MDGIDYAKIQLLVLDADGVLTDGRIALTQWGDELKFFHTRDGAGIKYWSRVGGKVAIISGRRSEGLRRRARELGVDVIRMNAKKKLPVYEKVLAKLRVMPDCVAVVGDDLTDLPLMMRCAFPVAVADAVEEVRRAAAYVTSKPGGAGAVREVVELILKKAGRWDEILARYIPADSGGEG